MMKIRAIQLICAVVMLFSLQVSANTEAVAEGGTPHSLVEQVTTKLLTDIAHYREVLDAAADEAEKEQFIKQFYSDLTTTLEPVVDFRWIALNVMGASRKVATPEQIERFRQAFGQGLVETYGRGLLTYSDQKIVVLPPEGDLNGKRRVTVVQEIQGSDQTYPLLYSMGLNRQGEWKVVNVIINGINLGSTFRNQFAQAVEKYDGDLDQVIAKWAADNQG